MGMRRQRIRAFAPRAALAALTWYALTDGASGWDTWIIGLPAILFAAAVGTAMSPPFGWSWRGALRFVAFFVRESWLGAVDVARRAFDPRMPIAPGLFEHQLRMSSDLARVAAVNTSSLLPGSLVVDIEGSALLIHALDLEQSGTARTVAATEERVAEMFSAAFAATNAGETERHRR